MLTLVIYNVKNSGLNRRLRKLLLDYGGRRCINIFECELDSNALSSLRDKLQAFPFEGGDYAVIYPLCQACRKNISAFGPGFSTLNEDSSFIVF